MKARLPLTGLLTGALALSATTLTACGGSGGPSNQVKAKSTSVAAQATGPLEMIGRLVLFLAEEAETGPAPGTDFNGNGSFNDRSPVVVDIVSNAEVNLDVAALEVHLVGDQVFVVVDEAADGRDWGGGGAAIVLLNWSFQNPNLTFVDEVEIDGPVRAAATATKLLYATDTAPADGETTLRWVDTTQPTTPMTVLLDPTEPCTGMTCTRSPRILGQDEGILFCLLKESVEGEDLNGDGDDATTDDDLVLALYDTTDPAALLHSTHLAVGSEDVPYRAHFDPFANDWWVGFLVNEAAQDDVGLTSPGGFNDNTDPSVLNDATGTFLPVQCANNDMDLLDDVLFWLQFKPWVADPTMTPPVNTGLSGVPTRTAGGRVVITDAPVHVGTIERESDQGSCDLNQDGDTVDRIARWVEAAPAPTWITDEDEMLAIFRAKGGTEGFSTLGRHIVAVVDENADGRDHNNDPAVKLRMISSRDPQKAAPGSGSAWVFDHGSINPGDPPFYAHTDWLDVLPSGRMVSTVGEKGSLAPNGLNPDGDKNDFVPTINAIVPGTDKISFLGRTVAAAPQAAGITLDTGEVLLFFRADETEDSRDWNGDGDKNDVVLLRVSTASSFTAYTADVFPQATRSVMLGPNGGAFIADEVAENRDYNQDGDKLDKVVRFFRLFF